MAKRTNFESNGKEYSSNIITNDKKREIMKNFVIDFIIWSAIIWQSSDKFILK